MQCTTRPMTSRAWREMYSRWTDKTEDAEAWVDQHRRRGWDNDMAALTVLASDPAWVWSDPTMIDWCRLWRLTKRGEHTSATVDWLARQEERWVTRQLHPNQENLLEQCMNFTPSRPQRAIYDQIFEIMDAIAKNTPITASQRSWLHAARQKAVADRRVMLTCCAAALTIRSTLDAEVLKQKMRALGAEKRLEVALAENAALNAKIEPHTAAAPYTTPSWQLALNAALDAQIEQYDATRRTQPRTEAEAARTEVETARAEAETARAEAETARKSLSIYVEKLASSQAELATARDEITKLTAELATARDDVTKLTAELATARDDITGLTIELATARDDVTGLTIELATTREDLERVEHTIIDSQLEANDAEADAAWEADATDTTCVTDTTHVTDTTTDGDGYVHI